MNKGLKEMSMSLAFVAALALVFAPSASAQSKAMPDKAAVGIPANENQGSVQQPSERMDMVKAGEGGYWKPSWQHGYYDLGYWPNREGIIP